MPCAPCEAAARARAARQDVDLNGNLAAPQRVLRYIIADNITKECILDHGTGCHYFTDDREAYSVFNDLTPDTRAGAHVQATWIVA